MSLFKALIDIAAMPIRIGIDIVKAPVKIMEGHDNLLENTAKGIEKIEEDLDE